ncbi:MAG: hypothetical protein VB119_05800 [Candidatus Metalachnospira sp.]|nr:hypothetical protein [Candidatus Metalachnospira sp.]
MKPKKIVISVICVILLAFIIRALTPKSYSGEEQMAEAISKELNTDAEIFETVSKGDKTFAGFYDGNYGYALFNKKDDGTFELSQLKKADKLAERAEDIFVDNTGELLIVISNNSKLWKITFKADNGTEEEHTVFGNPSLSVIELPNEDYNGEYNFCDSHGLILK